MKNTQKGFVKALLAIIIVLLIVGGGFYFVYYKETTTTKINSLNSYTSSTGFFSLKYPTTWIPLQLFLGLDNFRAEIPSGQSDGHVIFFVTQDIDGAFLDDMGLNLTKKESFDNINGYLTNVYESEEYTGAKFYIIHIGQYEKKSINIIVGTFIDPKLNLTKLKYSTILDEAERVLKSITINKNETQITQMLKTASDNEYTESKNAVIKADLNNMYASVELYYDNNKDSYSGFCKSEHYLTMAKKIESVTQIRLICKDGDQDYVFSSALIDGGFWCVDSSGVSTNTKAMDTKNACLRQERESSTNPPSPRLP